MPEALSEENYVSYYAGIYEANPSAERRRAIEAHLVARNRQHREAAREQEGATQNAEGSPKRKRADEEEESEATPAPKRARSATPPPAEPAPVSNPRTPSPRPREEVANAGEQVAFADQTARAASPLAAGSPTAGVAPTQGSPTPSLKRKRSEDELSEDSAEVEDMLSALPE